MITKIRLTKDQALEKIKHYCAWQERCHFEVKEKLYSYGLIKREVEEILCNLIENNYLNEERFAVQFAGGKFRMKQWGRRKIQYELQQKSVSVYNIKIGLKEIDEEIYLRTLQKLALAKWKSLGAGNKLLLQKKTTAYLLQKGYESSLINRVINQIRTS